MANNNETLTRKVRVLEVQMRLHQDQLEKLVALILKSVD